MNRGVYIFICNTPLHIKIVERIIKEESLNGFFIVVFIYKGSFLKLQYYIDCLPDLDACIEVEYSENRFGSLINVVKSVFEIKKHLLNISAKSNVSIFAANYRLYYARILIRFLKVNSFYGFDDGAGSLIKGSYFDPDVVYIKDIISSVIIGRKYSYSEIIKNLDGYYTVFKKRINKDYNKTKVISLYPKEVIAKWSSLKYNDTRIVLLLSAYSDNKWGISQDEEYEIVENICRIFDVQLIIPHPANNIERYRMIDVDIINDPRISEDIIMDMLMRCRVKVIGLNSTVLLNLASLEYDCPDDKLELINVDIFKNRKSGNRISGEGFMELFNLYEIKTYCYEY